MSLLINTKSNDNSNENEKKTHANCMKCNKNELNHSHKPDHNREMSEMNHSIDATSDEIHVHKNEIDTDTIHTNETETETDTIDEIDNKTISPDTPPIEKELKTEHNAIIEDWRALKEVSIEGAKCKLVPYTVEHVATYNKWLNDPQIQQMTQTEPYSLDQEYEYQKEWKSDETKYIFIVLDKTWNNTMCGDINIFIQQTNVQTNGQLCGELNIMIAEDKSRRKGIATETLQLMILFARKYLEINTFIAKISSDNHSSIKLFKKLGFVQTDFIDAFKEYTFTLTLKENENENENNENINVHKNHTIANHTNSYSTNSNATNTINAYDNVKFKKDNIYTD